MRITNVLRVGRVETSLACQIVSPESNASGEITTFAVDMLALLLRPGTVHEGDPVKLRIEVTGESFELEGMVAGVAEAAAGLERCKVRLSSRGSGERTVALELLERILQTPAPGRRRSARVERQVGVTCLADEQFEANLVNLSRDGLALEGRLPLKEGDTVRVRIAPLSFARVLELPGRVVYVRRLSDTESRAGMRFEGLGESEQKVLDEYIRTLLRSG